MATQQGAATVDLNESSQRDYRSGLPMGIVILAIVIAGLGAVGIYFTKFYPLVVAFIPLLICGFLRPQALLILAIAMAPFSVSLTGERVAIGAFGISDIFLFVALPGILAQVLMRPGFFSLSKAGLPIFLYLAVGLLSFIVNIPHMHGEQQGYFIGYLRTVQIIVLVPLSFAIVPWSADDLRNVLRGYMLGSSALAVAGIIAFADGHRKGLYILGNNKNLVGLALALSALLAIAALTQPTEITENRHATTPSPLKMSRRFLAMVAALCGIGMILSLSRGSYVGFMAGALFLSVTRKRGRIFAGLLLALMVVLTAVVLMLPNNTAEYVTDVTTASSSNNERVVKAQLSMKEFRDNWAIGDGFRARRDFLPHNLEMTLLAENGALGTLIFFWVLVAQTRILVQNRRLFMEDPLREWLSVAALVSSICLLVQSQFDPYWRRGPLWLPWAGMGMAIAMTKTDKALYQMKLRRRAEEEERVLQARRKASRLAKLGGNQSDSHA